MNGILWFRGSARKHVHARITSETHHNYWIEVRINAGRGPVSILHMIFNHNFFSRFHFFRLFALMICWRYAPVYVNTPHAERVANAGSDRRDNERIKFRLVTAALNFRKSQSTKMCGWVNFRHSTAKSEFNPNLGAPILTNTVESYQCTTSFFHTRNMNF